MTNPLTNAMEFMNLNSREMEKWMQCFEMIDVNRVGKVTMDEIFMYLEETPSKVFQDVFIHMDARDEDGLIEFGDFMRSAATFCFFAREEVLKYVIVMIVIMIVIISMSVMFDNDDVQIHVPSC